MISLDLDSYTGKHFVTFQWSDVTPLRIFITCFNWPNKYLNFMQATLSNT